MSKGGFYSDQQAANFGAARTAFQRGQATAPICGARTRSGGICRGAPIKGSMRCIRHCGPKAAREYRARQQLAFQRGKISASDWLQAEANRARNRLHDRWKKNPWLLGCTIDLGAYETEFETAIMSRPRETVVLPPAVMDWLRWRFRRLQVDRCDVRGWQRCLIEELPLRMRAAGPAPEGWAPDMTMPDSTIAVRLHQSLKRQRADKLKVERDRQTPHVRPRGRPRTKTRPGRSEALAATFFQYRNILVPLLERCPSRRDRDAVLRVLHDYVQAPNSVAKAQRWQEVIQKLR